MYLSDTTIDSPSGGAPSPAHPTANAVRTAAHPAGHGVGASAV